MKEIPARISFSKNEVTEIVKDFVTRQGYHVKGVSVIIEDIPQAGSTRNESIKDLKEISVSIGLPTNTKQGD